jgi:uncharacterized Zn finger protein
MERIRLFIVDGLSLRLVGYALLMDCPYCGTDDGTPQRVMQTHYTRVDCKWCGAEMVISIEVQKPPDESKLLMPKTLR